MHIEIKTGRVLGMKTPPQIGHSFSTSSNFAYKKNVVLYLGSTFIQSTLHFIITTKLFGKQQFQPSYFPFPLSICDTGKKAP
jgi:hypothetical protein